MGAPKIYRWDDTDAPQAYSVSGGGIGVYIDLFKACLVDGLWRKRGGRPGR